MTTFHKFQEQKFSDVPPKPHIYQTFVDIQACVSVPSAVSSMLERLCPRLMPLTAGGRSTLDPLSWGVEDVTSGGTLFSGGEKRK